jgi:hypothetical protein
LPLPLGAALWTLGTGVRDDPRSTCPPPTWSIRSSPVGNSTGAEIDKFAEFGLTPEEASRVAAPLIAECYANFKCRLADPSQIAKRGLFIWEVVAAHVAGEPIT